MYILGIGGYTLDAAAVLVRDGELIAAVEEERFTRRKHEGGMPYNAIDYCLKTGIRMKSNLKVCYNSRWFPRMEKKNHI